MMYWCVQTSLIRIISLEDIDEVCISFVQVVPEAWLDDSNRVSGWDERDAVCKFIRSCFMKAWPEPGSLTTISRPFRDWLQEVTLNTGVYLLDDLVSE